MRKATSLFVVLAAILAMGLLVTGCKVSRKAPKTAEVTTPPTNVTAVRVDPRDLDEMVEVTGSLKPLDEVTVGPRLAGRIVWVVGKSGTRVRKGQVVVRMDDTDARSQVNAAKARLEQAKAAVLQQRAATDSGIQNAQAAVAAAQARLQQAKTTRDALAATTNAQIAQAKQAYNAANSRLIALQNGSRSQERTIAENSKKLAEATLANDKRSYERYKTLYANGAVSKSVLDGAETKMQISQAQYDSAVQQLSLVNEGARQEDVDAAKAGVEQAKAALESAAAGLKQVDVASDNVAIAKTGVTQAEAALATAKSAVNVDVMRDKDVLAAQASLETAQTLLRDTNVYSPVDGVVSERIAEVGQSVGAAAAVLRLSSNNALCLEAQVSELEATRLRTGQPVYITIDAMQGNRSNMFNKKQHAAISGMIERVVPVVDSRTRNFTVRVVVADSPEIFPGMFARGEVLVQKHRMTLAVPKEAVVTKDNRQVAFVADNGVARERAVTLGAADDQYLQVLSGITAGEQVITVGQQTLQDGDRVAIQAAK